LGWATLAALISPGQTSEFIMLHGPVRHLEEVLATMAILPSFHTLRAADAALRVAV